MCRPGCSRRSEEGLELPLLLPSSPGCPSGFADVLFLSTLRAVRDGPRALCVVAEQSTISTRPQPLPNVIVLHIGCSSRHVQMLRPSVLKRTLPIGLSV